jgi:apolipoprotein D and lipocalin family protein
MFKPLILAMLLAAPWPALAQVRSPDAPMQVVQAVDLERYLGTWYEIARFPNKFEAGCTKVTAAYSLRQDGKINVVNSCTKEGKTQQAKGLAWVISEGKLKVTFVPWLGSIAAGDYWILDLKSDYSMAVVGAPKGGFGWILARKPKLSAQDTDRALKALAANGYDTAQLEWVQQ